MFYQIFLSPQVKRSAIISNKHEIYYAYNSKYDCHCAVPSDIRNPKADIANAR